MERMPDVSLWSRHYVRPTPPPPEHEHVGSFPVPVPPWHVAVCGGQTASLWFMGLEKRNHTQGTTQLRTSSPLELGLDDKFLDFSCHDGMT